MAKRRSNDSGKAKRETTMSRKSPPVAASGEMPAPNTAAKMPRGLRKQLRRLERQLSDAAQKERKRVRKLERAHHRRQVVEAALDELRAASPAKPKAKAKSPARPKTPEKPKAPAKAASTAPASTATPPKTTAATAKAPAKTRTRTAAPARPRAARPAAPRRTAPKSPPAGPAASSSDPVKP
jgi:hypothetical protein